VFVVDYSRKEALVETPLEVRSCPGLVDSVMVVVIMRCMDNWKGNCVGHCDNTTKAALLISFAPDIHDCGGSILSMSWMTNFG